MSRSRRLSGSRSPPRRSILATPRPAARPSTTSCRSVRVWSGPRLRADWKRRSRNGVSGVGGELRGVYQSSRYVDPAGLGVIGQQATVDVEGDVSLFNGLLTARARIAESLQRHAHGHHRFSAPRPEPLCGTGGVMVSVTRMCAVTLRTRGVQRGRAAGLDGRRLVRRRRPIESRRGGRARRCGAGVLRDGRRPRHERLPVDEHRRLEARRDHAVGIVRARAARPSPGSRSPSRAMSRFLGSLRHPGACFSSIATGRTCSRG